MNQTIYEQLKLGLEKNLLMFICLINKLRSNPILDSIIKQVKLKYNNILAANPSNARENLTSQLFYLFIYLFFCGEVKNDNST